MSIDFFCELVRSLLLKIIYFSNNFSTYNAQISFTDARSCVTCDKVLEELEKIDDDTDTFGVDFVKINDKRLAKQYGITKFPALTYFREREPIIYEGNNNFIMTKFKFFVCNFKIDYFYNTIN